ncbi:vascular endothelial growth factor receptor 1 isoform X2 [Cryptotermes secundus]|uniref:vascular endothelial growth factor receptor 1 isoform X2 n=1 Tax=Cryptotermes secundus TaxID=105785 RepID=UPI001454CABA|nr:vascular endothelial growth factor receptor 1 isoform X2 [Cryptotermes secundus]
MSPEKKCWEDDTQITTAGETIELDCKEEFPVHWCYPRVYSDECMTDKAESDVEFSHTTGNKYKTRLIIKGVQYADTGYYYCVSNDTAECRLQMEGVHSKYIYVKDDENLLAMDSFCHINAELQGNTVLPCRPTSPDIKITLFKDERSLSLGKQKDSDMRIAYKSTTGFILENISVSDSGTYMCKTDSGSVLLATVVLKVNERKRMYVMKPVITGPEPRVVRKGKDMVLECKGFAQKGVKFQVMWHKSKELLNASQKSCTEHGYDCIVTVLRIKNVTEDDGGNYSCVIKDKYNNKKKKTRTVEVIGEKEVGITLKSDSSETILVQVRQTKELKIVVNVFSPENVTLNWYGPRGIQLHPDVEKYGIESGNHQAILKVFNLDLRDAGKYSLDAYNSNGKVSLNRLVIVQDKPNASLNHDLGLLPLDSIANFSCVVWSPKPVIVNWFFRSCDLRKPGDCDGERNSMQPLLTTMENNSMEAYDMFNFSLKSTQGILRCAASNSFGSGSDSLKLYVSDHPCVRKTPHLWGEPEDMLVDGEDAFSVVEGENFTLNCASSVYNSTQYPEWRSRAGNVSNSTGSNDLNFQGCCNFILFYVALCCAT